MITNAIDTLSQLIRIGVFIALWVYMNAHSTKCPKCIQTKENQLGEVCLR
ncbi:hypothetical protein VCR31J2_1270078 [Vibrio coralliirubri]|uniref:Uncharacterized protein n=1 Tax=Vibrio coralliirubri TaxID=1516159 RepID=A0AA86WN98_9VIBR|nr:hypothetical protein VCR31J2_1270078 [Vibrio coralliirubri]CDT85632.1 hypothetical protein VCR8J2_240422 [Vibrio coralliirubri]